MDDAPAYRHHHEHAPVPVEPATDATVPGTLLTRRTLLRAGGFGLGALLLAACQPSASLLPGASPAGRSAAPSGPPAGGSGGPGASGASGGSRPTPPGTAGLAILPGFDAFAATVKAVAEGDVWLISSDGMPAHQMMVGITSWQQQVPTPQPYSGGNAWRIPARPAYAEHPVSARTQLYRGAIALAVNGVPIFNALNNRGDDALLAGELDKWGGHSGRADDYHYHVAPFHLQAVVGPTKPIAWALDGFPIYGSLEPDGSAMRTLDELNGHDDALDGYHYHGTSTYPYINGGLRGVVSVVGDQVDPQPVTREFRPAGTPLRGAVITSFDSPRNGAWRLGYTLGGREGRVEYEISGSQVKFVFTDPSGAVRTETYQRR